MAERDRLLASINEAESGISAAMESREAAEAKLAEAKVVADAAAAEVAAAEQKRDELSGQLDTLRGVPK
jgi:chromosome segregation ATPase